MPLGPRLLPNATAGIVTVELRQPDVEQDHVGPKLLGGFHGGEAIVDRVYVVAHELEHHSHAHRRVLVVVDDQNPAFRRQSIDVLVAWERTMWQSSGRADRTVKLATVARPVAVGFHRTSVHLDQSSHKGQADS